MTSMCQPFNKKASTRYGQKLPLLSAVRALTISLSTALNQISTLFWVSDGDGID